MSAVDCVIEETSCCTSFDDPSRGSTIAFFEVSIAQLVLLNVTIKQYGCSPLFLAGPDAEPELVLQNVALEMEDGCDPAALGTATIEGQKSVNSSGCSSTFTNARGQRDGVCSEFTECVEAPLVPGAYIHNVFCKCVHVNPSPYPTWLPVKLHLDVVFIRPGAQAPQSSQRRPTPMPKRTVCTRRTTIPTAASCRGEWTVSFALQMRYVAQPTIDTSLYTPS